MVRLYRSFKVGHRREYGFAFALLLMHAALLGYSAHVNSPATDEPGQLVAGISHWTHGRFELYRVTPPLVRLVAAIPVIASGAEFEWPPHLLEPGSRPEVPVARKFIELNGRKVITYMTLARLACIPFSLIGAFYSWLWTRQLYGTIPGLVCLSLWSFSPNMIGHGQFITTDVAGASFFIATLFHFCQWLSDSTFANASRLGIVFGLLMLCKATYVILFVCLPIVWLITSLIGMRQLKPLRDFGALSLSFGVCLYVVNLVYGFDGTFRPLGDYHFTSNTLVRDSVDNRFSDSALGMIPVPFPEQYVIGVDVQKAYFDRKLYSYLRGHWQLGGWWYYYIYGMAIKIPLGTWCLFTAASAMRLTSRKTLTINEFVILFFAAAILMFVSSQTGFNKNLRYVLAVHPLIFIWSSQCFSLSGLKQKWLAFSLLGWSVASSLSVYPHSVSYFNELAGGPNGGHHHLIHTNIDFGQDLLKFKAWYDDHPAARPLRFACYGSIPPEIVGIEYTPPPTRRDGHIPPGWYALSINTIRGHTYPIHSGNGNHQGVRMNDFDYFLNFEPVAKAGYSIYIYKLTEGHTIELGSDGSNQRSFNE